MKVFGIIVCITGLLNVSKLVAETNTTTEILDRGLQQDSTTYFDPISGSFIDFETFEIDQENCTIGFSLAPGVYVAGRQVELTKMLFWSDDLIIASNNNFALCQDLGLMPLGEENSIKCDVFFRDGLGKGNDVMGLVAGLSELLRCDQVVNGQLINQERSLGASKKASCDPDGVLNLSTEATRIFQSCLNRKFN
ncbi:MAG: hypothetical protein KBD78_07475 [Oligoflexales bacterium]|nr:hypothetical protein [Oligoflexales bacterium]